MPFQSKAQQRKCYAMQSRGQNGTWDCGEFAAHTDFAKLPEKVKEAIFGLPAGGQIPGRGVMAAPNAVMPLMGGGAMPQPRSMGPAMQPSTQQGPSSAWSGHVEGSQSAQPDPSVATPPALATKSAAGMDDYLQMLAGYLQSPQNQATMSPSPQSFMDPGGFDPIASRPEPQLPHPHTFQSLGPGDTPRPTGHYTGSYGPQTPSFVGPGPSMFSASQLPLPTPSPQPSVPPVQKQPAQLPTSQPASPTAAQLAATSPGQAAAPVMPQSPAQQAPQAPPPGGPRTEYFNRLIAKAQGGGNQNEVRRLTSMRDTAPSVRQQQATSPSWFADKQSLPAHQSQQYALGQQVAAGLGKPSSPGLRLPNGKPMYTAPAGGFGSRGFGAKQPSPLASSLAKGLGS